MKLEQIMKDEDSLLGGRWFKRKHKGYCVRWNEDKHLFEMSLEGCKNKDEIMAVYHFNPEDFVADDWKWNNEKWYEGNFNEKYPAGVICWVWEITDDYDSKIVNYHQEIIKNVAIKQNKYVFWNGNKYWDYAEPVAPDEAPAIIENK